MVATATTPPRRVPVRPRTNRVIQTDKMVKRPRPRRLFVFLVFLFLVCYLPATIGASITQDWFSMSSVGIWLGGLVSLGIIGLSISRFPIYVNSFEAFLTINPLSPSNPYVPYGPGLHIAFPQEIREEKNNVSLLEATETLDIKVVTSTGVIDAEGSMRLEPDITRLDNFLTGVGSVASDMTDLIATFVSARISGLTFQEAEEQRPEINLAIQQEFVVGDNSGMRDAQVSDLEERLGIIINDITIVRFLPSPEVQKTLNALAEGKLINEGTKLMLPPRLTNYTTQEWAQARDRFMAASENIKMNLDAHEYTLRIEGLTPDAAAVIAQYAPAMLGIRPRQAVQVVPPSTSEATPPDADSASPPAKPEE